MGALQNIFTWSFSAANDFDLCRRKRYWSKYGAWGGWDKKAPPEAQKAYQLNKMDNIYSLQGQAAENAVMWVLHQHQQGKTVSADEAYEVIAKPFYGRKWRESRNQDWKVSPKKFCCMREHYYGDWTKEVEITQANAVVDFTKNCIQLFIDRVMPRIAHIRRDQELPVNTVEYGDPENFIFNGIKIYAIPDYAYKMDGHIIIHDWKSGKVKSEHREQIALYGLWAQKKWAAKIGQISCFLEYLSLGQVEHVPYGEEDMERVVHRIDESVADMAGYLVGGDLVKNTAVPKEEWELTENENLCRFCNFYELCKAELGG